MVVQTKLPSTSRNLLRTSEAILRSSVNLNQVSDVHAMQAGEQHGHLSSHLLMTTVITQVTICCGFSQRSRIPASALSGDAFCYTTKQMHQLRSKQSWKTNMPSPGILSLPGGYTEQTWRSGARRLSELPASTSSYEEI